MVDTMHPPLPLPPFQWHKFFKDMEFTSCNITSPVQSMAFCHILFNYLYRSIQGTHLDNFKKMQLDDTTIQTMISELFSFCSTGSMPATAPLPPASVQSPPHKKVKPFPPTPPTVKNAAHAARALLAQDSALPPKPSSPLALKDEPPSCSACTPHEAFFIKEFTSLLWLVPQSEQVHLMESSSRASTS
jgi:hypothetical protein